MAPPSPAMNADTAYATIRARAGEMPMDAAATSLPRRARNVLPTVPSRMRMTANDTSTNTATASARNDRSLAKSQGPIVGRGTRVPSSSAVSPPPIHDSFTSTESKKKAKARVAIANQMPPRRSTGSASSAPQAAATAAPMTAASMTDMP
jgi:hypothetical protein